MKIGVLLINLGTPAALTENAVRDFLDFFLSDPYVIALPTPLRYLLVKYFILKTRPKKTLEAYQKIWTPEGSPLLVNTQNFCRALQQALGDNFCVALGMRYSEPSIEQSLTELNKKDCEKIIIFPLFPHFSAATTQTIFDEIHRIIQKKNIRAPLLFIREFYDQDFFTTSLAHQIKQSHAANFSTPQTHLLLSYHGLPNSHSDAQRYRHACFSTSEKIATILGISANQFTTAFQSRVGFTKWIAPYTDHVIIQLQKNGIKNLVVVCPSFITDCIETLEEINIRLRVQWMALGGSQFDIVACVNDTKAWTTQVGEYLLLLTRPPNP